MAPVEQDGKGTDLNKFLIINRIFNDMHYNSFLKYNIITTIWRTY